MTSQFSTSTLDPDTVHPRLEKISDGNYSTLNDLKNDFRSFRGREYRSTQSTALDFIINSRKKFIVIEAPTGAGKSLIGMAAGKLAKSSIYTVHSKPLQVQLQKDFPEAFVLFGRSNYPCSMSARFTCAECPLLRPEETCTAGCPYKRAKVQALASQFRVLNYAYLLSEVNYVGRFSKQGLIVIDEADSLEQTLYDFISIAISESRLKAMHLEFPVHKTAGSDVLVEEWKSWAIKVKGKVDAKITSMTNIVKTWEEAVTEEDQRFLKQIESLQGLQSKLAIFITNVDQTWQSEIKEGMRGGKVIHFKPLWLTPALTGSSLWRHADRFILMSATFPPMPVLAKMFGISPADIDYLTLPSTFPVENRRCFVVPVANLTHKTQDAETPKILDAVRKILKIHSGEKGLIHTVNYKLAQAIMKDIPDPRLVTHNSFTKQEVLDAFRASDQPLVLVSPSSERGISLEDSQCRFIVMCKAPYLSLADKAVKARTYAGQVGQQWYTADMLLTVVQAMGRGVRHEEDFCVSYLLDEQIALVMSRKPSLMPPWFRQALEFENADVLFGISDPEVEKRGAEDW